MELEFRKSSHSGGDSGTCVEVAQNIPGVRAIRDSKDPSGPVLSFQPEDLSAFITGVKAGRFYR